MFKISFCQNYFIIIVILIHNSRNNAPSLYYYQATIISDKIKIRSKNGFI